MRKMEDDPIARTIAENQLADAMSEFSDANGQVGTDHARRILDEFKAVNLETVVSKVAGEEIRMRRLVIVGPWEVDPNGYPGGAGK